MDVIEAVEGPAARLRVCVPPPRQTDQVVREGVSGCGEGVRHAGALAARHAALGRPQLPARRPVGARGDGTFGPQNRLGLPPV